MRKAHGHVDLIPLHDGLEGAGRAMPWRVGSHSPRSLYRHRGRSGSLGRQVGTAEVPGSDLCQGLDYRQALVLGLLPLVLMPMLALDGLLDLRPLVVGQHVLVDEVVEHEVGDVREAPGVHVQEDGAGEEQGPQLEEGVQGEGAHVGLGPALAALLHVLLELDPPGRKSPCSLIRSKRASLTLPGGLLPLCLAVLVDKELLHLGEDGVRLEGADVGVGILRAEHELDPLRRGRGYSKKKSFEDEGSLNQAFAVCLPNPFCLFSCRWELFLLLWCPFL